MHTIQQTFKTPGFLICRPDRIGDAVLALPLIEGIKRLFPNSFVAVLVRKYTEPIFMEQANVDKILVLDSGDTLPGIVQQIRELECDYAFSLLPNKKVNLILFLAGIKNRFGVGHKFYQFLFNVKNVYRNGYVPLRHEADYCLDFLRKVAPGEENMLPEAKITLSASELNEVITFRDKYKGKKLIGMQVLSGGSAPNLPQEEYLRLFNSLKNTQGIEVFVHDQINPFEQHQEFDANLLLNIGKTLRESFIYYAAMDIFIAPSTGPLHLCSALGVKTIGLYCPLPACSPVLWEPKGVKSEIVFPEEDFCANKCPGDPKKCTFSGAGGIDAERIISVVNSMI